MFQIAANSLPWFFGNGSSDGKKQVSANATVATPVEAASSLNCENGTSYLPGPYAEELRSRGLCVIPALQVSQERMDGIASQCRQIITGKIGAKGAEHPSIWPNVRWEHADIGPHDPCGLQQNNTGIPQDVIDVINDLAAKIWSLVQLPTNEESASSGLQLSVLLLNGMETESSISTKYMGWHVDYRKTKGVLSVPHVRFICTLYGQTTRFVRDSEPTQQLKAEWEAYRNRNKQWPWKILANRLNQFDPEVFLPQHMAQKFFDAQNPVFSPEPGEVVAFIAGTQNGTIHSAPMYRDPGRTLIIFDLYDRAISSISRSPTSTETVGKAEGQ